MQNACEPAPPAWDGRLIRLRLDLAYDGTDFSGWARQPARRTVQAEVESAIAIVLRLPDAVLVQCAGRTDAGVHARGQVAHVDIPAGSWVTTSASGIEAGAAQRINGFLPADIVLRSVTVAPDGFDARFSALRRHYTYRIADSQRCLDPLARRYVLEHQGELDIDSMNAVAQVLLGQHDFAAFCRRREGATTIRTLLALRWTRNERDVAVLAVSADAFCHSMVRSLVGAMLAVGQGRRGVDWISELLTSTKRQSSVAVVAPHGLVLESVDYPADDELQARTQVTRALRTDAS